MRQTLLTSLSLLSVFSLAQAQRFTLPKEPDRQHEVKVGTRVMSGVSVEFSGGGNINPFDNLTGDGNYYNNGYVNPDSLTASDQTTGFFGYRSAEQFVDSSGNTVETPSAAEYLEYNRYMFNGNMGTADADSSLGYGWDIEYTYFFTPSRRLGLSAGFSFSGIDSDTKEDITGTLTRYTDSYALSGLVIPSLNGELLDRYREGSYYRDTLPEDNNPSYVIPIAPEKSETEVVSTNYTGTSAWDIDAAFYNFRFGPTYNLSLGRSFELRVSVGVTAIYLDSRLEVSESFLIPNADGSVVPGEDGNDGKGSVSISDSASSHEGAWLFGGYADAGAQYKVTERLSVFSSLQYQATDDYSQTSDSGHQVDIDMASQYYLRAGFGFNF